VKKKEYDFQEFSEIGGIENLIDSEKRMGPIESC
jgi:hypothetical protein